MNCNVGTTIDKLVGLITKLDLNHSRDYKIYHIIEWVYFVLISHENKRSVLGMATGRIPAIFVVPIHKLD